MKELKHEELEKVTGGTSEYAPHCLKCHSTDLELVGPADIGTPPRYHCKACDYEWMMAL